MLPLGSVSVRRRPEASYVVAVAAEAAPTGGAVEREPAVGCVVGVGGGVAALVGGGDEAAGGVVGLGGPWVVGSGVRRVVRMHGFDQAVGGVVDHGGLVAVGVGPRDGVAVGIVAGDFAASGELDGRNVAAMVVSGRCAVLEGIAFAHGLVDPVVFDRGERTIGLDGAHQASLGVVLVAGNQRLDGGATAETRGSCACASR